MMLIAICAAAGVLFALAGWGILRAAWPPESDTPASPVAAPEPGPTPSEVPTRRQILMGTAWQDVELCSYAHCPVLREGVWQVSPLEFARRFDLGLARLVDGDIVVTAGRNAGALRTAA